MRALQRSEFIMLLIFLFLSVLQPAQIAQAKPAPDSGPVIVISGGSDFFKIINNGTAMTVAYSYTLYQNSVSIDSGTFLLESSGSLTISVSDYGEFSLNIQDNNGVDLTSATLSRPAPTLSPTPIPTLIPTLIPTIALPSFTINAVSVPGTTTFTIINTGSSMPAAYTFTVKDGTGSVVKTASFQLSAGASMDVDIKGVLGNLCLDIVDDKGTIVASKLINTNPTVTATATEQTSTSIPTTISTSVSTTTSTSIPTSTDKPGNVVAASETPSDPVRIWYTLTPTSTLTSTITITPTSFSTTSIVISRSSTTIMQTMTQTSMIPANIPGEESDHTTPVWILLLIGILLLGLIVFLFFQLRKK